MINMNKKFENKKICVIGAGLSGIYGAALAAHKGADTFLSEGNKSSLPQKYMQILEKYNVNYELGGHSHQIEGFDFYIISPGIPKETKIYQQINNYNGKVISEIEFASRFAQKDKIIAVTGTNGKSTTVRLISHFFNDSQYENYLGGNIGTPFSQLILETEDNNDEKIFILEISSFQMEDIIDFSPYISVILNISPDHMDRYDKIDDYLSAKLNITKNQDSKDIYLFNGKDHFLKNHIPNQPRTRDFNEPDQFNNIIELKKNGDIITLNGNKLNLRGKHNFENILAALSVVQYFDLEKNHILEKLESFQGLSHRLEFVKDLSGIRFYNDSKSTNIDSVLQALNSFSEQIILILGGQDKELDFSKLNSHLQNVRKIVLIGTAKEKIKSQLENEHPAIEVDTMEEAVQKTYNIAKSDDVVLLSPGCASFDMYEDYKHRGNHFKQLVNELE